MSKFKPASSFLRGTKMIKVRTDEGRSRRGERRVKRVTIRRACTSRRPPQSPLSLTNCQNQYLSQNSPTTQLSAIENVQKQTKQQTESEKRMDLIIKQKASMSNCRQWLCVIRWPADYHINLPSQERRVSDAVTACLSVIIRFCGFFDNDVSYLWASGI